MTKLHVFGKKEVKKLEELLEKNYGAKIDLSSFVVLTKGRDNKIWIASKAFSHSLLKLPLNSIGLYIGKLKRNEKIQLSVEGSQLVGPKAKKNLAILNEQGMYEYMQGLNVKPKKLIHADPHNFLIVKSGSDFLGVSILINNVLKNMLPKSRRIVVGKYE